MSALGALSAGGAGGRGGSDASEAQRILAELAAGNGLAAWHMAAAEGDSYQGGGGGEMEYRV